MYTTAATYGTKQDRMIFGEKSDHLGNVRAVVSDIRKPTTTTGDIDDWTWEADITDYFSYYPFGMLEPGRQKRLNTVDAGGYRFGFQGQEKDDEISGTAGTHYNYTFRMHDSRIGRFWSIDPLRDKYPWNSPYAFSENSVLRYVELEGLEKADPEMFENANVMMDHYEDQINSGTLADQTQISGLKLSTVIADLRTELQDASSANTASCQNLGYYCGKNALQNVTIQYNPMAYASYILDLAIKGESQFGGEGPTTYLDESLKSGGLDGGANWGTTRSTGEIFGKSLNYSTSNKSLIRHTVNLFTDELSEEENSIPFEMRRMMRYVGLKPMIGRMYRDFEIKDINNISNAIVNNYIPIVFENHGISHRSPDTGLSGKFGIHFVTMHGLNLTGSNVSFSIGHYGRLDAKNKSVNQFTEAMKAYWIPIKK